MKKKQGGMPKKKRPLSTGPGKALLAGLGGAPSALYGKGHDRAGGKKKSNASLFKNKPKY